jgi:hypothetical protein
MTITLADSYPSSYGTNNATLGVTNSTIGDYRLVSVKISSVSFTCTGLSGGGVTTWTLLESGTASSHYMAVFGGVVTATGSQTVTASFSGTTGVNNEIWSSELVWSGGIPSSWNLVTDNISSGTSTTISGPALTSTTGSDQAYWATLACAGTVINGSTSGFSYATVNGNGTSACFDGTLAASTAYTPTASQSPSGTYEAIGVIVQAIGTTSGPTLINAASHAVATTGANAVTSGASVSVSSTLLLLVQVFGANSTAVGSIADTKTGTWIALGQMTDVTSGSQFILWQCTTPQTGVAHVVTWTPSAADAFGSLVTLTEWRGGPFSLDQMEWQATTSGASASTPSITPAQTGELLLVGAADNTGSSSWTSPTNSFAVISTPNNANVWAYKVDSTTSSVSCGWTISPSDSGDTAIFALIPGIAVVQSGDTGATYISSGSAGTVLTATATLGNCVVLNITAAGSDPVISVTSPMGTFVRMSAVNNGVDVAIEQWVCSNVTGSGNAVTVTNAGVNWTCQATEFSGVKLVAAGPSNGGTSTSPSSGTISIPWGGAAVVLMDDNGVTSANPASPWVDAAGRYYAVGESITAAYTLTSGSQTATATIGTSAQWTTISVLLYSVLPHPPNLIKTQAVQRASSR